MARALLPFKQLKTDGQINIEQKVRNEIKGDKGRH